MPKVILEFNLPEDKEELYYNQHGFDYSIVIEDLLDWLRTKTKYEDQDTIQIDEVRSKIVELLKERDLTS